MFLSIAGLLAAAIQPTEQCSLSFSRTTALADRDHPITICVQVVPGPEPQQLRFLRTMGPAARTTVISSTDCPIARARLAALSQLAFPQPFVPEVDGPETLPVIADGTTYRVRMPARFRFDAASNDIDDATVTVEAYSRNPLARWVDDFLEAIEVCPVAAPNPPAPPPSAPAPPHPPGKSRG